ncbi:MAG TPA: peptidylprolyl isomerase [Steroidobacteraceae bacterium]|jgi:peptidyl-prolyl cis-trans isomerase D|nr:peptidylprolyl isomerase [Steroidobacteraceae bacterium]
MLQSIGDRLKGHKWLAYLLLGPLAFIFAAWGAYGIVNLSVGSTSYAAEANGSKISLEEARNAWLREQSQWQQRLGGTELPLQLRDELQNQVLEGLIRSALLAQRTQDLGYRVSHDELLDAIHSEGAFQVGGQYSADAAKAALAQAGISLDEFQSEMRSDLRRSQLENGIRVTEFVTPTELKRLRELEDEEREVRYLILPDDKFPPAAPDDAAVAAYYKAHQAQYLTPESAHLQYAELLLPALEAQETVTDADLHAQYDKEKSRLMTPERRRARHILITGPNDAAALKEAQDVLAQARAGKDFSELAGKYSKDPGSARNGGDLGWADRSSFVGPFADALFSMKAGEIAGPVKTQYGYHIIRLDAIQAAAGKTFEEARAQLETDVRRDRATDRFGDIQEQLQSKLAEPNVDLGALALEFKLQQGDVPDYLRGEGAAPLGPAPALQELVFGDPPLAPGKLGGPVLVGDNALVIVKVLERRKPAPKPLVQVRAAIVAAITKERESAAALQAAQALRAKLEAGGSFDQAAAALGLSVEPAHFVGRNDPSVPAQVRTAVFAAAKPAGKAVCIALPLTTGGAAVAAISRVRTGAATQEAQAQAERVQEQAGRAGLAQALAYVAELRRTASVRKNPKAFE